jgi:acetolactate synthase-1/2/3 large subunit
LNTERVAEVSTMKPSLPVDFRPETAAELYLGLLAAREIDYLFANGGTDFAPLVEAYAKGRALGWRMPAPVIVPHENLGVAMAHGVAMITGRPQAMMVHVGVGTANAVNGLINAARQNVPLLFTAGRTPLTESGSIPGARNNYIHWAQEHFDQGAMLREFVKWDFELKHAEQVEAAIDRALAIAKSEPQGPVYLTLPREVLASSVAGMKFSGSPIQSPATAPGADLETLEEVARLLASAERPLVITANGGRTVESALALTRLAETFALPVIHYRPRYLALPTEHPMQAGWDPHALLKEADLVVVVDCDVPWIPAQGQPRQEAKIVHIGPDPLFARYPLRGFRTDIALTGTVAPTLEKLLERTLAHAPSDRTLKARFAKVKDASDRTRATARAGAGSLPAVITAQWATACLNEVLGADSIVVNEYPLVLEELTIGEPGRYYSAAPAGGLGWGLGAALGAKLAARERTVICAVGDGSYMFGNPTPAHYVAAAMNLPVLWVVFNNARWAAVQRATLSMYPKGEAVKWGRPPFATLEPSPHFELVCQASGGFGERVTDPKNLRPALKRAMKVVKEEGRQALVNVCLEASYVKTS